MARAREEDIREPALLVHDSRRVPVVVEPRRRGLAREALHASEGEVLDDDLCPAVLDLRVVVARIEHEGDVAFGRIGEERGEEGDRLDGGIAVLVSDVSVVDGAEGVVEAAAPVLGGGRMQCDASARAVEEGPGIHWRFGMRRVGNVVDVKATIC